MKYFEDVQYQPSKPVQDMIACIGADTMTFTRARDRAAWLLRSGQIGIWILDVRSQVMLINSHEASHDRRSPVSLFSAMLVQSLIKAEAGAILYWSCGENVHSNSLDIVRQMIGQLLESGERSSLIEFVPLLANLTVDDFEAMLEVFIALLKSCSNSGPIFIIIDSVSFYEDRRRLSDTRMLFDELHSCISTWNRRNSLKVLATSPTRCSYLGTFLDDWKPVVLR